MSGRDVERRGQGRGVSEREGGTQKARNNCEWEAKPKGNGGVNKRDGFVPGFDSGEKNKRGTRAK